MRLARFDHPSFSMTRLGVLAPDRRSIRPLAHTTLEPVMQLSAAERVRLIARAGESIPLEDVTLRAPLRPTKNVFCVGRNYREHIAEGAAAQGLTVPLPKVPQFFTKSPHAISDPNARIAFSAELSSAYDWEGELGVVIGRTARDVAEADALEIVFGYTCINDLTARDLQRVHDQWFKGKSLDGSCPMGPFVVTADEVSDVQQLTLTTRVNGVVKQQASTASMIFPVTTIIAQLTRGLTVDAGDVIATGTPEGVGYARKPPEFLRDGDTVEVEIEGIGILRNTMSIR
jgi:2-keto-4-pentenoate hydratase/2-oxohepta-3-ene-1,7-dioic acid hydratase in catechol pathway